MFLLVMGLSTHWDASRWKTDLVCALHCVMSLNLFYIHEYINIYIYIYIYVYGKNICVCVMMIPSKICQDSCDVDRSWVFSCPIVPFVRLWVVIVWVDQQQEPTVPRRFLERCLEVQCHALSGALVVAEGLCQWRCFRTLGLWFLGIYTLSCIKMNKAFQI